MKDKVVIITGASSGIGKALAEKFSELQANLVLAARNEEALKIVADKFDNRNKKYLIVKTDVSIESDCRNLIEQTISRFGKIDILINNAGISMRALFQNTETDVLRQVMGVNFWGAVYCSKYALPYLISQKGSLVGISSIAGFKGLPGRSGYSASKFALQGFLEVLRIENRNKNLHVLIACPGFTASNIRNNALNAVGYQQGESPRNEDGMMTAEDVAGKIINAIQKKKTLVVMTLQGRLTVLLNKFFPALVDKLVFNHLVKEPDSPFK